MATVNFLDDTIIETVRHVYFSSNNQRLRSPRDPRVPASITRIIRCDITTTIVTTEPVSTLCVEDTIETDNDNYQVYLHHAIMVPLDLTARSSTTNVVTRTNCQLAAVKTTGPLILPPYPLTTRVGTHVSPLGNYSTIIRYIGSEILPEPVPQSQLIRSAMQDLNKLSDRRLNHRVRVHHSRNSDQLTNDFHLRFPESKHIYALVNDRELVYSNPLRINMELLNSERVISAPPNQGSVVDLHNYITPSAIVRPAHDPSTSRIPEPTSPQGTLISRVLPNYETNHTLDAPLVNPDGLLPPPEPELRVTRPPPMAASQIAPSSPTPRPRPTPPVSPPPLGHSPSPDSSVNLGPIQNGSLLDRIATPANSIEDILTTDLRNTSLTPTPASSLNPAPVSVLNTVPRAFNYAASSATRPPTAYGDDDIF